MYRVLIVDDEELDLKGMQEFIPWSSLGLEVAGAVNNGYAAFDLLQQEAVDILVTDVHMPRMTGLELAERALQLHGELKVIFVSGYQDFHYVRQALQLRAWGYVLKPMDDAELVAALEGLIRQLDGERGAQAREAKPGAAAFAPLNATASAALDATDVTASEAPKETPLAAFATAAGKGSLKHARLISELLDYVDSHLHEHITLKLTADAFSFSPNYLGSLFKEETGKNFSEHLIEQRMRRAGELLLGTRLRVYEIADRIGYRYMPYFSRQFKETFGVTPNEYRRSK
ncbi:Helix-turn-helix domain-containing protein [Paenibacillaceae bacterium GAS479]|nr:Helix-turn-helix domain-containing protein [Paenibacillaceae bacterium GAS479]